MSAFSFTKYSSSALNKAATLSQRLIIYQSPRVCRGSFFKVSTKTHDLTGRVTPQLPTTHNSSSIYFNFLLLRVYNNNVTIIEWGKQKQAHITFGVKHVQVGGKESRNLKRDWSRREFQIHSRQKIKAFKLAPSLRGCLVWQSAYECPNTDTGEIIIEGNLWVSQQMR